MDKEELVEFLKDNLTIETVYEENDYISINLFLGKEKISTDIFSVRG